MIEACPTTETNSSLSLLASFSAVMSRNAGDDGPDSPIVIVDWSRTGQHGYLPAVVRVDQTFDVMRGVAEGECGF